MKAYNILAKITALLVFFSSIILMADDTDGPWLQIADLMKSRDYDGVIDKLSGIAKDSAQVEHRASLYFQIGSVYFEYEHDYVKAMEAFQKVLTLKKSTNSPSTDLLDYTALSQMSIADIYRRTGEYDKAISEYEKIMDGYPETISAKIASEDIKGIKNALAEINSYKSIIAQRPDSYIAADIQFEIAELYLSPQNLNNPDQAIKEYNIFIDSYPDNPKAIEAQFKIADTYRSILRDPLNSIYSYQKILEQGSFANNLSAEATLQIGIIYYSDLHEYSRAAGTFSKFLEEYPVYWKFPAGLYWQAMCYEKLGEYDKAIDSFGLFSQLYPDNESKLDADIGRLGERDVKSRIKAKIEELKGKAAEAQWNKANQLASSGDYRQTLSIYRSLMSEYPDTDYARNAGNQTKKIELLAEIQILQEISKKQSSDAPSAKFRMGEIFETQMQDYPSALKEYQEIVDNYSGTYWTGEALLKMGIIYSGMGNIRLAKLERRTRQSISPNSKKAIEIYQQLIREYPDSYRSAEAHYYLGEIYRIQLHSYDKAIMEYEKVISDYPKKNFYEREGYKDSLADQAQFRIGRVYYENLKDDEKALEAFRKFLSDYPDSCRKASAYSFLASIQEAKKDYDSAINSLEAIVSIIADSSVQSLYFMRDSLSGIKLPEGIASSSELQGEIMRQISQKISQISRN